MSEVMLHGVLKMPSTMWHEDSPIDNMQRQARYFEASELIYKQADKIAELEKEQQFILSKVGFDKRGFYLPCGNSRTDVKDSIKNIREALKEQD